MDDQFIAFFIDIDGDLSFLRDIQGLSYRS